MNEKIKTTTNPNHILKSIFGFDNFRGEQEVIVSHILAGNNALVLMPTGGREENLCVIKFQHSVWMDFVL